MLAASWFMEEGDGTTVTVENELSAGEEALRTVRHREEHVTCAEVRWSSGLVWLDNEEGEVVQWSVEQGGHGELGERGHGGVAEGL